MNAMNAGRAIIIHFAFLFGSASVSHGQEAGKESRAEPKAPPESEAQPERDRRLEAIERTLRDLLKEVEGLRGAFQPGRPRTGPAGAAPVAVPEEWLKALRWRSIGPANMGGRIVDLAVVESDPSTFWVATASGGLLKTTNNGITFEHQFDHEATVSLGAVAVAPSDPRIVWVGTGENNPRNSVSYGDGVYRSTDGGKTWKNMGLRRSYQIGRIVIHPRDPAVVYVGALGRLYGPGEERGVFKTTNGGEAWEKVLYIDDRTGVIDMAMHPRDPDTLIAAAWERMRDGFDSWPGPAASRPEGFDQYDPIKKWGQGSGLHKTTDGGRTWRKLTRGLPSAALGRLGIDWYRKDPDVLYAVVDCESIGKGPAPLPVYFGAVGQDRDGKPRVVQVMPESPAAKAGLEPGDVFLAAGGETIAEFDQVLDRLRARQPGEKVKVAVARGEETRNLELALTGRPGTGRTIGAGRGGVWLGVMGEDREGKVELTQVVPEGPAAKAGLAAGDLVVEIDGKPVGGFEEMVEEVRGRYQGDKVTLRVARGEETREFLVELEQPSGQEPAGFTAASGLQGSGAYLGIQGEDAEGGARLTQITDEGPGQKAGLAAGDLIQELEGKKIESYEALVEEIRARKPGDVVKLGLLRAGEVRQVAVTLETRPGGASRLRPYSFSLGGQSPNVQDQQGAKGFEYGGVYRSGDGGESWTRVNSLNSRPMYFSVIRIDPGDEKRLYLLGVSQYRSSDGGQTFQGDFGRGVHADGHALWIDPRDGRHMVLGTDGGTYLTYDRGSSWDHLNHTAIGQFYHVAVSSRAPYHLVGGLQDNGTWMGPSLGLGGSGPINEDWISVGGGDGFMCRVDPEDPDLIYFTSQDGNMARRNLRTGERGSIRPVRQRGAPPYRFNWNTPFILSSRNPRIFYCAGNHVFRSLDRGNNLQVISPEITHSARGSASALVESPRSADVLYAGTDDGALWVTRDGGKEWKEVSVNVGLPGRRWVATLEASRFEDGRVYAAFDGHRSDDDEPYLFVSEDFGRSWQSLRSNLPWGSTRCLREDVKNPDLLFAGTEFGAWFSISRGRHWNRFNTNLPTVAVHEIALHPENGELVAATHGRSLWITEVTPLRQLTSDGWKDRVTLYDPGTAIRWRGEPARGRTNRRFTGTNPAGGARIYYSLPRRAQQAALRIVDIEGAVVRELRASRDPGLHLASWDLRSAPRGRESRRGAARPGTAASGAEGGRQTREDPRPATAPSTSPPTSPEAPRAEAARTEAPRADVQSAEAAAGAEPARRSPRQRGRRSGGGPPVPPGSYRIVLTVDGQELARTLQVVGDPNAPPSIGTGEIDDLADLQGLLEGEGEDEEEEEEEEAEGEIDDVR